MWRIITEPLDKAAIKMASRSTRDCEGPPRAAEAQKLLQNGDFLQASSLAAARLEWISRKRFRYPSAIQTPYPENNVVHGKFYPAGRQWQGKPSIVLVHGWNGELGYWLQFPWLALQLNAVGFNVGMIELPYHAQRKPGPEAQVRNFISHDLLRMVEAAQQAISDLQGLIHWLSDQGSPFLGLWGISLGSWLSGLTACHDLRVKACVLMSPVVRMDRAIDELEFCEATRRSLHGAGLDISPFNLASHRPRAGPESVLILNSVHDLFAPNETIDELWEKWGQPERWKLAHGHISVLMSLKIMHRTVKWLKRRSAAPSLQNTAVTS